MSCFSLWWWLRISPFFLLFSYYTGIVDTWERCKFNLRTQALFYIHIYVEIFRIIILNFFSESMFKIYLRKIHNTSVLITYVLILLLTLDGLICFGLVLFFLDKIWKLESRCSFWKWFQCEFITALLTGKMQKAYATFC